MVYKKKKLNWRSYITTEILSIIKKVKLINKKKFVITAKDKNTKKFMVYIAVFSVLGMKVHHFC